jgi:superfamily II RNA helicase
LRALLSKRRLQRTAKDLRKEIAAAESMILKDDLRHRKRVLRRLGHLEASGRVSNKGHVRF